MDLPFGLDFDMPDMDSNFILAMALAVIAEFGMFALFGYYTKQGMKIALVTKIICYVALPFISYFIIKIQASR